MTKQVIAVTQIIVTVEPGKKATATEPAQKPKTKTIAPGTLFMPQSEAQYNEFKSSGAVRDMAKGEKPVNFADLPIKGEALIDGEPDAPASDTGNGGRGKRGRKPAKGGDDDVL